MIGQMIMKNQLRYHRDVYFPENIEQQLNVLLHFMEKENWYFTYHSVSKLLAMNTKLAMEVSRTIFKYSINTEDIFEVCIRKGYIAKFSLRIKLNETVDLIIVCSNEKSVVSLWINNKDDTHETLDVSLYEKGE